MNKMTISRRDFIKKTGIGLIGLASSELAASGKIRESRMKWKVYCHAVDENYLIPQSLHYKILNLNKH